jgi:hypothetical protein
MANNYTPPLPLTYTDLVGLDDLDPTMSETTSDLQNLLQDVYHILLETLGSNLDDQNRGVGVYQYLSGTSVQLTSLPGVIETQLGGDNRIDAVSATLAAMTSGPYPYVLNLALTVDGSVINLSYGYSQNGGLTTL